jgi:hypothetical protein
MNVYCYLSQIRPSFGVGSAYVAAKRKAPAFHHRNANLPNSKQSLDSNYDIAKSYAERFLTQPTPIEGRRACRSC